MDKEALIKIILSDINEVETLVKSFQGQTEISEAFIDLTERKLSHIKDEFSLLKSLSSQNKAPINRNTQVKETSVEELVNVVSEEKEEKVAPANEVRIETPKIEAKVTEEYPVEKNPEQVIEKPKQEIPPVKDIPVSNNENPVKEEEKKEETSKTLGETLIGEKKSVNDIIASAQETKNKKSLMGKPINDLTKGLGLNDRFMFQRELFEGKSEVMQQTLQQLNEMPDLKAAQSFIASNFNWDEDLEVTQSFFNYIKRKY